MSDDMEIRKVDGRSKEARSQRQQHQAALPETDAPSIVPEQGAAARSANPSSARSLNRGEFRGRSGEVLTRTSAATGDEFGVPTDIIPEGWSYQWNVISVVGNPDIVQSQNLKMFENGWRPVPAERHPGRFKPHGETGAIVRGGQMLMERPLAMTKEAQLEDKRAAQQQMQDRDSALMGGRANVRGNLGHGFEMNNARYRGTGGDIRMSISPELEAPRPSHSVAKE